MTKKILLADDHPLFRKGLRLIFEEEHDMRVVGEAGNGQEAIDLVRQLAPDVVVMDITMPDLNGIEATRQIHSESPATKVVALSIHTGKQFVQDMLSAGAAGYILKDSAPEELTLGIRKVLQGDVFLSSAIATVVVSEYKDLLSESPRAGKTPVDSLTAGVESSIPVNKTKLYRPPIPPELVHRSYLIDRFDQNSEQPITLVVAPAGYGKSTLISQWLTVCDNSYAWLSLDEDDNDLRTFLIYFTTAVQRLFPDAVSETRMMLNSTDPPISGVMSVSLINELAMLENRFTLVLDDYHVIQNKAIHNQLIEILKHPPPSIHLVLASRIDPPLPLASLRATGEMTEIRVQDLRFSLVETNEYLQKVMGKTFEDNIIALLDKKTEGWITGLRLAALSLNHREDIDTILTDLPDDNRYVMDYMVSEVLSKQEANIQEYLLSTSILSRFCAPLCQAVYHSRSIPGKHELSGRNFIDWIEQANLFVIPLDDEHRWFRFHHLFQELLKNRLKRQLSRDEIDTLHQKAGEWFAGQGLIEEALHHFMAGGDTPAAARLIARHRHHLLNQEQWHRLDRWLSLLPSDRVDREPELLLAKIWLCENQFRLSEMESLLNKYEALFHNAPSRSANEREPLTAEFNALKAFQLYIKGDGQGAISHSKAALEKIDSRAVSVHGFAQVIMAGGYQMTGQLKKAYAVVHAALENQVPQGTVYHSRLYMALCFVHWIAGNLTGLRQAARQLLKFGQDFNLQQSIATSHYFLGVGHYLRNELGEAEQQMYLAIQDRHKANALNYGYSAFVLALCLQATYRPDDALEVADELIGYALKTNNSELLTISQAFQADLYLRQGDLPNARRWAENFEAQPFNPGYRSYIPQLTLAKVHLADGTNQGHRQAEDLLSQLQQYYRSIHNTRHLIDTLALQALSHDARSREAAAFENLIEALRLAEPDKIIRPFLDLGSKMADLLGRLAKQDVSTNLAGTLLKAFRSEIAGAVQSDVNAPASSETAAADTGNLDSLSKRELEIMTLLARRLSNKEIAEKLFLSEKTVKSHLYNIYQKLNVKTRRQAVEKARALGIV